MGSYKNNLLYIAIDFDNFGSLIDETILTIGDIKRNHINKEKLESAIILCTTVLKGNNASRKDKPGLEEFDAYKKYQVLASSKDYFKKQGLKLEEIVQQIKVMKKVLENIQKDSNASIQQDQLKMFQMYLSKISIPFRKLANLYLMYAKAKKL